jgi:hypothetical protein
MPVNVLKGNIKGRHQRPMAGYYPKPEVKYPSAAPPKIGKETAESRAGGGGEAEEAAPAPAAAPAPTEGGAE